MRFYVKLWQAVDIILGLRAAALAAVVGAAGVDRVECHGTA